MYNDHDNTVVLADVEIVRETDGAILIEFEGDEHWIPKSLVGDDSTAWEEGDVGDIWIPEWFALKEGL